uniref:Venom ribonuclease 1 n=1 Tax=Platymeris rhadamanthus TaxID=1134088 RepID=A0A6B9L914_PLARH|nr:venom ribonuclease 1 [Platymeris rhadamanthus]
MLLKLIYVSVAISATFAIELYKHDKAGDRYYLGFASYEDEYIASEDPPETYEEDLRSNHFDALIFTQSWPPTSCLQTKQKSRQCRNLANNEIWTIHGIWPTAWGTNGPSFCDKSHPFSTANIKDLISQLEHQWPTIEKSSNHIGFWAYEWKKHGTCALQLPQLNTQHKYFFQALNWNSRYNILSILSAGGIIVGRNYPVAEIWNVVTRALGVHPQLMCLKDNHRHVQYLSEIKICFDKNLSLINCKPLKGRRSGNPHSIEAMIAANSNCNINSPVTYPTPSSV